MLSLSHLSSMMVLLVVCSQVFASFFFWSIQPLVLLSVDSFLA
jgi:hypothetical protein